MIKHVTTEEYFKNNQYAIDIFNAKYAFTKDNGEKETASEVFYRVASELAKMEETKEKEDYYRDLWFDLMYNGWFRPGGSIIGAVGSNKNISTINCTTIPVENDSLEDISKAEYTLMKAAAFRQGMGLDLSNLRPRGSSLGNAAEISTGTIPWGRKFSNVGNYVGQCLDGETLIDTNKGKIEIKDIVDSNEDINVYTHKGYKCVINKMNNGKKELYKLTSSDGESIIGTEDHRFIVFDTIDEKYKKIKMKDLKETDKLVKRVEK